jgi:hypothetical protein
MWVRTAGSVSRVRGGLAGIGLGVGFLLGVTACDNGAGSGASRYCDVVKVVQAGADPLADQSIYGDPAKLKAALEVRVKTYTDLAAAAPKDVQADADTVRDSVIKVNNALNAAGYQSAAANSDPTVKAVLADQALQDAQSRLAAYDAEHCTG